MTDGVIAELSELIALRRYAQRVNFRPEGRVMQAGNHLSKLRGRGMDFAEVRNYQAGDEIRHMEWRVTARTGKPHIKLYEEERERPVVILVDFNSTMYFGTRISFKSVIAARLAALIAWTVIKQGDRLGGLLFSGKKHDEFIPRSREAGVLPFLAALSQYTRDITPPTNDEPSGGGLTYALQRVRRVARPGSIVVIISDFYTMDNDTQVHLNRLRNHNDMLVYQVCDPLELAPPEPQLYAITNGQEEALLDTSVDRVYEAYQAYVEHRMTHLHDELKRLQIQYVSVMADMDLPLLVRQTFPRKSQHA